MSAAAHPTRIGSADYSFYEKLNSVWHKRALNVFTFIVLAHWAEHLAQAYQIYVLGWARPRAGGFLGLFFPWLVSSEVMHYGYAIVMLVGIWMLRKGFTGTSRKWWTVALVIQFWHHIEHAVLQWQALTHHLLVRLASAGEFSANAVSEISSRDTSLLQRGGVHADGNRDVLSPVSAKGRRGCGV